MASPVLDIARLFLCLSFSSLVLYSESTGGIADDAIGHGYELISLMKDCHGNLMGELKVRKRTQTFGDDVEKLAISVSHETKNRLHLTISDAQHSRWKVPYDVIPRGRPSFLIEKPCANSTVYVSAGTDEGSQLNLLYTEDPFGFAVTRKSTGEVLFNLSNKEPHNLVFKDQFIQVSTNLPESAALYGLGESSRSKGFRLASKDSYTLWDADIPSSNPNINLYGSHPFYLDVRQGGSAHGVLFLNSDGMDIEYTGSLLKFKTIGGIIDLFFFAGPSPVSVIQQYTELIGRPAPMPYWSFGFHQCRWGYKDVEDLKSVVAGYREKGIPLDVIWNDIDYMDNFKDFTVDPANYPESKMKPFLDELHASGQKYVLILDPGIKVESGYATFDNAMKADVFIKKGGKPYLAQVWPGPVYFPDFMNPKTHEFWENEISIFLKKIPADGLWIDMNEASNFCSGTDCTFPENGTCPTRGKPVTECCLVCKVSASNKWENPLYKINNYGMRRHIRNKTITPSAVHYNGAREFDTHNLYGFYETVATSKALKTISGKRPFILTRSTFVGSGAYAAHWTGDNAATWDDLKYSISTVLNFGLFGVPMVGADICGFLKDTTEELCARWIELGAFYPFSRQHSDNGTIRQELYLWDSVSVAAKKALALRYKLLPYLYTLSYESHMTGTPIARPLFFTFPDDPITLNISTQFLLGNGIMISPVLDEGATSVDAYFPSGTWYNLFDSEQIVTSPSNGSFQTLQAPLDTINVHLFEGSIVTMQEAALTTVTARTTPFTLLIAFPIDYIQSSKRSKSHFKATGDLFLDDGEDIEMKLKANKSTYVSFLGTLSQNKVELTSKVTHGEYALKQGWKLQRIVVLGSSYSSLGTLKINVAVEGEGDHYHTREITVTLASSRYLTIEELDLQMGKNFKISWEI